MLIRWHRSNSFLSLLDFAMMMRAARIPWWFLVVCGAFPPALVSQTSSPLAPALVARMGGTLSAVGVAASPDGRWFATEANDGALTIWSTEDGDEYRTFPSFAAFSSLASPGHVAVASDATTIAVLANADVHLYDVRTATELRHYTVSPSPWAPWQIAANPKSMALAIVGQMGNITVISLDDGHALFHTSLPVPPGGAMPSLHVQFSPDGRQLAIIADSKFQTWDWAAGRKLLDRDATAFAPSRASGSASAKSSPAQNQPALRYTGVSFSPDGRHLALSTPGDLHILNLPSGTLASSTAIQSGIAPGCIFADNDQIFLPQMEAGLGIFSLAKGMLGSNANFNLSDYAIVPGKDRGVALAGVPYLVKASDLSVIRAMFAKARPPESLAFTADGTQLFASTYFKLFASWSLASGEADPVPGAGDMLSPAVSANGKYLASVDSLTSRIHLFELADNRDSSIPVAIHSMDSSLSFSADGSLLGLSQSSGEVDLISVPQKTSIARIAADHPTQVAVSPDGATFAVADRSGTTVDSVSPSPKKIVNLPIDDPQHIFSNTPPNGLRFSPDGQWLAILETTEARIVSTKTWTVARKIDGTGGLCLAISPDSRRIAFQMQAQGVELLDLTSGAVVFQDNDHLTSCPISFSADGSVLAASSQYGTELFSAATGQMLANLYLFSDESKLDQQQLDWLVVTPDGLFDGTPAAWDELRWRFSNDTFDVLPVEIFFQDFYHPGLLAEIVAGRAPTAPTNIANVDRRQPHIAFVSPQVASPQVASPQLPSVDGNARMLHLEIAVSEAPPDKVHRAPSGARDLRLFRNGTLVQAWQGPVKLEKDGKATVPVDVPIVAGENHFTAYAFSSANIKSADASLLVNGSAQLERKGIAWVVSIGANHYAATTSDRNLDLNFAEADAADFSGQFTHAQDGLRQFAEVRRIDLLGANATRVNLEMAFRVLAGQSTDQLDENQRKLFSSIAAVQPEDGVFIFYAGHGAAADHHFYLITQDYNPAVPLGDPRSHTVSDVDLSRMLDGIAPARSFLIIDACNSGQAIDSSTPAGPVNSSGLAELAYEKGMYILAASKNSEPALETGELGGGHGFLTYALVEEGLKQGAAAFDGTVALRPWFNYAVRRVPQLQSEQLARRALFLVGADPSDESRQHPRVFYRREAETAPFIVAKILAAAAQARAASPSP